MGRRRAAVAALLVLTATAACSGPPASTMPPEATPPVVSSAAGDSPAGGDGTLSSGTPSGADPWQVADVPQPLEVTTGQSPAPGVQCHPCHFLAENQLLGIGSGGAGLIAVGVEKPPGRAVAFTSRDGRTWTDLPDFTGVDLSSAVAVASAGGRSVIVGVASTGAVAWVSTGGSWTAAPAQADLSVPDAAGGMTTIATVGGRFVAGGYRGHVDVARWDRLDGSGLGGRVFRRPDHRGRDPRGAGRRRGAHGLPGLEPGGHLADAAPLIVMARGARRARRRPGSAPTPRVSGADDARGRRR